MPATCHCPTLLIIIKRTSKQGDYMNPQEQPSSNPQFTTPNNNPTQFAPTPAEPPKGKKTGLLVAIAIAIVLILGVIVYTMLGSDKKDDTGKTTNNSSNTGNDTATSDKFQKYDVNDKMASVNYSISFYKSASVSEQKGRTYLTSGETGSQYSVYLGPATGDTIDCGNSATTTMRLGGESSTVCYKSDNTQYAGYAKAKNGTVKLNLAGQKAISMEDAKAIMESIKFN